METSQTQPSDVDAPARRRPIFPWIVPVVAAVLLVLANFQNEIFGDEDPGIANLANLAVPMLAVMLISIWYLIRRSLPFNGGTILASLGLLTPLALGVIFEPTFGGNAEILGIQYRIRGKDSEVVDRSVEITDPLLSTTTDFDFPQFLGPNRNGMIQNVTLLPWADQQPELLWKQQCGAGWSGFAIVNGYVVTQEQRGEEECVVCYQAETGALVWIHRATRRHDDITGMGRVGPRATPLIHDGNVFAVGATGILECLDGNSGDLIWSYDVPANVGIEHNLRSSVQGYKYQQEKSSLAWGRSGSPLFVGDKIVIPAGGMFSGGKPNAKAATLIAIDAKTGKMVWKGGQRMIAYGSPSLATIGGVEQILLTGEDHAVGHDPETGEELWSFPWPGSSAAQANCSQVTVLDSNTLLLSKGYGLGAEIIELAQNEDGGFEASSRKKDRRVLRSKFSNPVISEGHAYSITNRFFECVELATLRSKWRRRGFETGQLLMVGDKLLVHAQSGELALVATNPDQYEELGRVTTVEGTCWNTLGFFKDMVFVRSEKEVACFRLAIQADEATQSTE